MNKFLSIALISSLGFVVYSNTFHCSFHLDDQTSITENFSIRNIHNLLNIWNFLPRRFLLYLSLALNFHFNGLNVYGYHQFNLAVHLCTAVLVWWLVLLTLSTPAVKEDKIAHHAGLIALLTGLVFVSHPVQTQSVTYIVQRASSMAALFYLLSLCLYIKSRLTGGGVGKLYYIGSLLSAILAMFTKETAVTLPLMILLYEFSFFKTKKILNWGYTVPFLITLLIIPLTILFTETSATRLHALQSEPGISSFQYLLTQTRVMVTYIRLSFLPLNQNIYYDYSVSKNFFELPVLSSLLFIMTVLYFAKSLFLKYRILSVSIFWFFLTLLPESSFLPIKDVIFEHRLYLPLAGYCMFLVSGMYYLLGKNTIKTMVVALMMVIAWNSFLTYQRNKVWLDEFSLWEDSVQKSPHIAGPYNGLGLAYLQQGDLTRALADFNKAIELDPKNAETYNNRGNIYSDQGKFNEAISDFNNSIGLNPDEARAYNNRGIAYSRMGKFTEALSDYNKAIKVDPELAWIYYDRAILYTDQGKLSQALSDYNLVLRIDPGIANAYINRGIIFDDTGNLAQARADYNTAIKINPGIAEAYLDRGNTYRQQGDLIPALLDYNNAIAINVKYSDAYYQRALIYYQLKEYDKAWEDANKAKELGVFVNPDFKSLLWQIKNR